jgi:hypothetical protein
MCVAGCNGDLKPAAKAPENDLVMAARDCVPVVFAKNIQSSTATQPVELALPKLGRQPIDIAHLEE